MSAATHTPGSVHLSHIKHIASDDETRPTWVAETYDDDAEANAARLVLCWNSHNELVAALDMAHRAMRAMRNAHTGSVTVDRAIELVAGTLAKVRPADAAGVAS